MAVFPPDSHNKYDRCSTMAFRRDFNGWYKSCSHWSNFLYPWKDSTRYPRQVGPIGLVSSDDMSTQTSPSWCCGTFPVIANCHWSRSRANMTAWRHFDEVLGCATPWQPPVPGPAMFMNGGAMHATHYKYQGHAAAKNRGSFGLAKQKFWFECDLKLVVLHQTIIKQCQHYRP